MKSRIKAIVFDLDDTLYSEDTFRKSGFKYIAEKLNKIGIPITKEEIYGLSEKYPRDLFNKLILFYKLPYEESVLIDWYRYHKPRISVYSGVKMILTELKKKYRLGLLTDYFSESQKNKLRALGIEKYFDKIIYTEIICAKKPSVKGFELLKKNFACDDNEIVYVGDNEVKDFLGANKSGYVTIKFNNDDGFHSKMLMSDKIYKARFEITRLSEIFMVLEKLII